ncbi:MAG: hypothetical protein AAGF93_04810 [Cyanobacteria bacterium P01_H01_bin.105]
MATPTESSSTNSIQQHFPLGWQHRQTQWQTYPLGHLFGPVTNETPTPSRSLRQAAQIVGLPAELGDGSGFSNFVDGAGAFNRLPRGLRQLSRVAKSDDEVQAPVDSSSPKTPTLQKSKSVPNTAFEDTVLRDTTANPLQRKPLGQHQSLGFSQPAIADTKSIDAAVQYIPVATTPETITNPELNLPSDHPTTAAENAVSVDKVSAVEEVLEGVSEDGSEDGSEDVLKSTARPVDDVGSTSSTEAIQLNIQTSSLSFPNTVDNKTPDADIPSQPISTAATSELDLLTNPLSASETHDDALEHEQIEPNSESESFIPQPIVSSDANSSAIQTAADQSSPITPQSFSEQPVVNNTLGPNRLTEITSTEAAPTIEPKRNQPDSNQSDKIQADKIQSKTAESPHPSFDQTEPSLTAINSLPADTAQSAPDLSTPQGSFTNPTDSELDSAAAISPQDAQPIQPALRSENLSPPPELFSSEQSPPSVSPRQPLSTLSIQQQPQPDLPAQAEAQAKLPHEKLPELPPSEPSSLLLEGLPVEPEPAQQTLHSDISPSAAVESVVSSTAPSPPAFSPQPSEPPSIQQVPPIQTKSLSEAVIQPLGMHRSILDGLKDTTDLLSIDSPSIDQSLPTTDIAIQARRFQTPEIGLPVSKLAALTSKYGSGEDFLSSDMSSLVQLNNPVDELDADDHRPLGDMAQTQTISLSVSDTVSGPTEKSSSANSSSGEGEDQLLWHLAHILYSELRTDPTLGVSPISSNFQRASPSLIPISSGDSRRPYLPLALWPPPLHQLSNSVRLRLQVRLSQDFERGCKISKFS